MYQRILVALDRSAASQRALDEAVWLAVVEHACLLILTVVDATAPLRGGMMRDAWEQQALPCIVSASRTVLERAEEKARSIGVRVQTFVSVLPAASLAARILERATAWRADLLVLGSHGATVPVLLLQEPSASSGVAPTMS